MPSYIVFNGHAVQLLLPLHAIVHFIKDFSSYYYICSQTVTGKLCVAVMDREVTEVLVLKLCLQVKMCRWTAAG